MNVNDVCVYAHICICLCICMALFFVALTKHVVCFSDAIGVELLPLLRQYQIVVPVGNEAPFFFLADTWSWGLDAFSMNMHHSVVVR